MVAVTEMEVICRFSLGKFSQHRRILLGVRVSFCFSVEVRVQLARFLYVRFALLF